MASETRPSTLDPSREKWSSARDADTLAVLLHAFTLDPASLVHAERVVRENLPTADILIPSLPVRNPFSAADPERVVEDVLKRIGAACDARSYRHMLLIGHSFGALVARKVYAQAVLRRLAWAPYVERIVLLAAMNRGWEFSHHLKAKTFFLWKIGCFVGRLFEIFARRHPLIFSIRRGAPFITGLRLDWLEMERTFGAGPRPSSACTIQLLGSVDDMVSPEDNVDLVTGGSFVYLDVPLSGHKNVIEMDDSTAGLERRRVFERALTAELVSLQRQSVHPADEMRPHADPAVTDVVFVIHGIRDWGHWTQKIARHVQREGSRSGRRFATETSSYGYFPMLPFLLPGRRRAKVHWLMDQYVEDRALYPNAEFSYVGHSNGTYLLARALEDYPAVSFKHIVFAGSVVRSAYPWSSLIQRGQAAAVLNYVATSDWVVAIFPKLFQVFHWQDLGGAGHDGFLNPEPPERIRQVRYIRGRHAAALDEHNWDQIASFVVHGTMPSPPSPLPSRQHWFVALLGNAPYLAWLFILGALCVGFYFVLYWSPGEGQSLATILGQPVIALRLAAFAAYLWLIKTILTRL